MFICTLFAWQGAGDDDAAEADVAKYVAGGLLPLHYGSIKYLPCYAAAGARIKLGYFDQSGKVCPCWTKCFLSCGTCGMHAAFRFDTCVILVGGL